VNRLDLLLKRDDLVRYGTLAVIGIAVIVPFISGDLFILNALILMLIFIIYASAWNLLAYSGQGSLGHTAFFGIGCVCFDHDCDKSGITPYITIFLGAVMAAFIGILIGLTCVRLKEWFLAMVTFGFAIIIQTITVSILAPVTGGWDGIASSRLLSLISRVTS
jgi:branched-chain amino acid transport system permease protein